MINSKFIFKVTEERTEFEAAIQMETINPKWIALRNAISIPFKMQSFMFIHINLPTMVQLMRLYTLKLVCNLYLIWRNSNVFLYLSLDWYSSEFFFRDGFKSFKWIELERGNTAISSSGLKQEINWTCYLLNCYLENLCKNVWELHQETNKMKVLKMNIFWLFNRK